MCTYTFPHPVLGYLLTRVMTCYSLYCRNHTLQVYQLSPINFDLNLQDYTTVYIGMYFQFAAMHKERFRASNNIGT